MLLAVKFQNNFFKVPFLQMSNIFDPHQKDNFEVIKINSEKFPKKKVK